MNYVPLSVMIWDSKAMDDVKEELHGLLGFDRGDRLSLYPFCELV